MNYYRYKLITPSGKISTGTAKLPFQDLVAAISHLESDGSVSLYVKKLGRVTTFINNLGPLRPRKKFSRSDQAELLSNLAMMLKAGLTLTSALEEVSTMNDRPEIANDLSNILIGIQGGASFSEAAANYGHIFPEAIQHLIRIGEETGNLDKMLHNGAEHLNRIQAIASDAKQALMYPGFVFALMGGGFGFWAYYVAPKILDLFKEMEVELPALTILIMDLSKLLQQYLIHIVVVMGIGAFGWFSMRKSSKAFRRMTDALLLKLPLIGSIISASSLAFITEYFSLMLQAGIDLLNSLDILTSSVGNQIYREKLTEIREDLSRGESITDSFISKEIFPTYVTRMIKIGETSGTLTEQLTAIAEEYRKKLSILVSTIGKTIEPVVLVVAGVLFAIIIGGLLLPVYDLVSQVSG